MTRSFPWPTPRLWQMLHRPHVSSRFRAEPITKSQCCNYARSWTASWQRSKNQKITVPQIITVPCTSIAHSIALPLRTSINVRQCGDGQLRLRNHRLPVRPHRGVSGCQRCDRFLSMIGQIHDAELSNAVLFAAIEKASPIRRRLRMIVQSARLGVRQLLRLSVEMH